MPSRLEERDLVHVVGARGVTSTRVVLDPGLVILRSREDVGPAGAPVLRGASLWALCQAREEVLASTE